MMISVIVPAHNEARVIGRLLALLVNGPGEFDIVVVCNGCTDDTAAVAAAFSGVRVLETPVPSKRAALLLGDEAADGFPRVYIDADVEIDRAAVNALGEALTYPPLMASAPRRRLPRDGVNPFVRWYYDIWEELPQVREGIFGRGVVAVSEAGHRRIAALPALMSDDLAMSAVFESAERRVVSEAVVVVHPPRTWADLMRRRARVATGTAQAYAGDTGLRTDARTSRADLVDICRRRPALLLRMPVFLAAAIIARTQAARAVKRGDFTTWQRDESSRSGTAGS